MVRDNDDSTNVRTKAYDLYKFLEETIKEINKEEVFYYQLILVESLVILYPSYLLAVSPVYPTNITDYDEEHLKV